MARVSTLVWGSVRTNGQAYFLLKEEPESPFKYPSWIPDDMRMWLVADCEDYKVTVDSPHAPVYRASRLIFGKNASVELLDDPQVFILVDYFDPEQDEDNVAVAPTN